MLPSIRISRLLGYRSSACSGLPSVDPLSAITTVTGRSVACDRVARNRSRCGPGEYVTVTTTSPSPTGSAPA